MFSFPDPRLLIVGYSKAVPVVAIAMVFRIAGWSTKERRGVLRPKPAESVVVFENVFKIIRCPVD